VGVDLENQPGTYDLAVQAVLDDGVTATGQLGLVVQEKRFSTRRLVVSERFVNPAAEEIARIERDAALLVSVFGQSSPMRLWRGPFALPVPGRSTSSFGRQTVLNGEIRARHRGADFRAAEGTPISAPNAGRVVLAQDLYFTGNTVVIDHGGGLFSLLAHLSRIRVAEGAPVARGDRVGDAGSTGRVTGPHLHWTVRLDDISVDPLSIVSSLSQSAE
jgi:murein DD-endopeptidase MepM/ murein hydrolase activator NlpD